jgi:hypothetical protein
MRAWSFLILLAGAAAAQPAPPAPLISPFFDRGTVTLRNATPLPLAQFFLWNHGLVPEGEDRLGGEAVPAGGTRDLVLGMGHCNTALRVIFADGTEQRIAPVHLCHARELVLEAARPPAARVIPR